MVVPLIVGSKQNQHFHRSSRLKQGCYLCFYIPSRILSFTAYLDIPENEIITKIAPILFNNPLCLKLTALVIGPLFMVGAIEAAVQVRSAKGTDLPPSHRSLDFQTLQACMASFHFFFTGKIFCTTYLLFSRHSMNASAAGTMHPKMLNQIGMFTPFATIFT